MLAPLDVEEERRLYPVIQLGRSAAAILEEGKVVGSAARRRLLRQRHEGQEAESLLLRSTLGLVRVRVVERGYRFGNDELEGAGVEGLVNALQRFDPSMGNRFSTYANYWIMKLVNLAIQQQAGLTDTEMRLVLKFQKLERTERTRPLSKHEVAEKLNIPMARVDEVLQMSRELLSRRFESADLSAVADVKSGRDGPEAPSWVIEALRIACGQDFDAFWQATFRTMPIEEIARDYGITRQGMAKRIDRCRRAVRESPDAARLEDWFAHQ